MNRLRGSIEGKTMFLFVNVSYSIYLAFGEEIVAISLSD